ncbi:E3 ubiquitin-protein ligase RNF4-like [Lutzomyia longipalpis]|uniref:E3 ubiquitin-protein ligase RNF4-like n=1 Tax=Lutzomyia longipalpis TaxID=7200 RepID=UPI002483A377|nr:E3 ubiquitin-protein ligase RNF4-like [Lutzomyia longipalpis]
MSVSVEIAEMSDSDDEFSPENVQALIAEAQETIRSVRNSLRGREPSIEYPPADVPAAVVLEEVDEIEPVRQEQDAIAVEELVPCDQSSRAENSSEPTGASANHSDSSANVPLEPTNMNSRQVDDEVILISETLNPNPLVIDLCSPDVHNIDLRPCRARAATPQMPPCRKNQRKRKSDEIVEVVTTGDPPPSKAPATSQPSGIPPCVICFEDMINRRPHSTICGHVFCQKCIMTAIQSTKKCPVCRKGLTQKSIHPLFMF